MDRSGITIETKYEKGAVVLPVDQDHFAEFISGLLGRPQSIERIVRGSFSIGKDDVSNVHALLSQRILRQNDSSLIGFSARIFYDDSSSVSMDSIDDFLAYNEVKPIISTGLELSWRWLVKFKGRDVPERQDINLSFRAGTKERDFFIYEDGLMPMSISSVTFTRVSHTDRSWGTDIDVLLKGYVENLLHIEPAWRKFSREHSGKIGTVISIILSFSFIAAVLSAISSSTMAAYVDAKAKWSTTGIPPLKELALKVEYLIFRSQGIHDTIGRIGVIASIMALISFSIAVGIFVSMKIGSSRPSYVALTKQSEEIQRKGIRKYENESIAAILATAASLIFTSFSKILTELFIKIYM